MTDAELTPGTPVPWIDQSPEERASQYKKDQMATRRAERAMKRAELHRGRA